MWRIRFEVPIMTQSLLELENRTLKGGWAAALRLFSWTVVSL